MNLKLTRFTPFRFAWQVLCNPESYRHSPLRMLPYWLKGFTTEHVLLFNLNRDNWTGYLQDALRYRITLETNRHVWPILHDKVIFDAYMRDRLPVPETLFYITEGKFNHCRPDYGRRQFLDEVARGQRFVLKPAQGAMGTGLFFVQPDPAGVSVNGKAQPLAEFEKFLDRLPYHLCCRFIDQHPVIAEVYPHSVNTLRISVYLDDDGQPRMLAPVLRAGSKHSAPLDSFFKGGILAMVDEATGRCIRGLSRNDDGGMREISAHPETGDSFIGKEIPHWQEIRQTLFDFHRANPGFDLVGWDVLVAPDRFYVIEGNHNPGLRLSLMFKNLQEEPAFRSFCERRGIIGPRPWPQP